MANQQLLSHLECITKSLITRVELGENNTVAVLVEHKATPSRTMS
jgi:hypothetical protein